MQYGSASIREILAQGANLPDLKGGKRHSETGHDKWRGMFASLQAAQPGIVADEMHKLAKEAAAADPTDVHAYARTVSHIKSGVGCQLNAMAL